MKLCAHLSLCIASLAASAASAATNILHNGGFELGDGSGGAAGWALSGGGAFLFNAGSNPSCNMLGEDKVGKCSLCLQQNRNGAGTSNSASQTATAVAPGQYRIVLQAFRYKYGDAVHPMSDRCMTSALAQDGTKFLAPYAINEKPYSEKIETYTTRTFPMPNEQLGKPFDFRIEQMPSLSSDNAIRYCAIDNVELRLCILEVAAETTLAYTNGIMSAEQSIYVRKNATLVFRAADGFETLPSASLWEGAKLRIDCAGWKGETATLSTSRGFLGPSQGAALDDPLSRIELVNARGVSIALSDGGKAVTLTRRRARMRFMAR